MSEVHGRNVLRSANQCASALAAGKRQKGLKDRFRAVEEAWQRAPAHVQVMAGPVIGPMLSTVREMIDEIEALQERIDGIERG